MRPGIEGQALSHRPGCGGNDQEAVDCEESKQRESAVEAFHHMD
jgi:hypothetical protein